MCTTKPKKMTSPGQNQTRIWKVSKKKVVPPEVQFPSKIPLVFLGGKKRADSLGFCYFNFPEQFIVICRSLFFICPVDKGMQMLETGEYFHFFQG